MERMVSRIYMIALRFQGACVLAFAAMFWLGLSTADSFSVLMIAPVAVAALATWLASVFAIPALTPNYLALPNNRLETITLFVVLLVSGLLFVMTIMGGIALFGISEPAATTIAVGASAASIAATVALMIAALCGLMLREANADGPKAIKDDLEEIVRTLPPLQDVRQTARSQVA